MQSFTSRRDSGVDRLSLSEPPVSSIQSSREVDSSFINYSSSTVPLKTVKTLYAFEKRAEEELTIDANQTLEVLNEVDPIWWLCRKETGEEGLVPVRYLDIELRGGDEQAPLWPKSNMPHSIEGRSYEDQLPSVMIPNQDEQIHDEGRSRQSYTQEVETTRESTKFPLIESPRPREMTARSSEGLSKSAGDSSEKVYSEETPIESETIRLKREAWEQEKRFIMEEARQKEEERRLNEERLHQLEEDKKFDELIKKQQKLTEIAEQHGVEMLEKKEFESHPKPSEMKVHEKVNRQERVFWSIDSFKSTCSDDKYSLIMDSLMSRNRNSNHIKSRNPPNLFRSLHVGYHPFRIASSVECYRWIFSMDRLFS